MKNKLKEKAFDLLCTFLGSFPAFYIYQLSAGNICIFLKKSDFPKTLIDMILASYFSLLVGLGFILALFLIILLSFFKKPEVNITFYNEQQTQIGFLDFTIEKEEPKFLRIKFETKLKKFQKIIIDWLNIEIQVSTNPKMCKIELDEGFSFHNEDYKSVSDRFMCNVFRNFQNSDNSTSVSVDVNVLLINKATGEIKVESALVGEVSLIKRILRNYCKYNVNQLIIKGE
ncbi:MULTISPECIES: hypothetical protein [Lactococcus]|nr:hypothetical protein [Lactococcus petauri]UQU59990.1 hypothetical protein lgb_00751 [Lactococcus petauri]